MKCPVCGRVEVVAEGLPCRKCATEAAVGDTFKKPVVEHPTCIVCLVPTPKALPSRCGVCNEPFCSTDCGKRHVCDGFKAGRPRRPA